MDFQELTCILAIAKHQNITKAAESRYVGQPTLSKLLIALENDRRLLAEQVEVAFYSKPSAVNGRIEYDTLWEEEMLLCTCKGHLLGRFAQSNPAAPYLHRMMLCSI